MKKIVIDDINYELVENINDGFDEEKLKEINITFDSTKNLDKKIPLSILILSGFILLVATFGLYVYIQYKKNSK